MGTPVTGFRSAGLSQKADEQGLVRSSRIVQSFRVLGGLLFIGAVVLVAIVILPFSGRAPRRRVIGKGSRRNLTPDPFEYNDWDNAPSRGYHIDFSKN